MIRYLRGMVIEKNKNHVVLDVQGVGYDVLVAPATLTSLALESEAVLHISESIREDAHDLYGFTGRAERDAFELLRKVSGVGPKVALAMIGFYPAQELWNVIHAGDTTKLSLVPGVGKKLASKVVLELKDKRTGDIDLAAMGQGDETVDALQSLGYSPTEIASVLPKIPTSLSSTSERVTWVLRHLSE